MDKLNKKKPRPNGKAETETVTCFAQEKAEKPLSHKSTMGWLFFWFAIALLLRFTNLASKPAWMDEVATILFSLGNSSRLIPINQVIDLNQILIGIRLQPNATAIDVVHHLLQEDNHPPVYFVLAHGWMQLFHSLRGSPDGYASLWASRALPAFFGALAVPATYILGWLSFRGEHSSTGHSSTGHTSSAQARSIGLVGAALMAVSPYSVFLSQEARHYTLAILMIIASLSCFALAVRSVWQSPDRPLGKSLNWLTVMAWIVINTLGMAVHYFCSIAIGTEGLVLLGLLVHQSQKTTARWRQAPWIKIYVSAAGSLVGVLIWLPLLLNFYGSPQTTFIQAETRGWKFWVNPIVQSVVGWLYALCAPITNGFGWQYVSVIVITTVVLLVLYAPWMLRMVQRGLQHQWTQPSLKPGLLTIGGFFATSNALFFLTCYGAGFDITRGHRYAFVYFPSIIILTGAGLAPFWQPTQTPHTLEIGQPSSHVKLPFTNRLLSGRAFVATVIAIGFLGSQVITHGLTHLKFYEPDRFVNKIREISTYPVVIGMEAMVSDQPSVIGHEIVSVAWEVQRQLAAGIDTDEWQSEPDFTIVVTDEATQNKAKPQLMENLKTVPRPFDLWLLSMSPELETIQCTQPPDNRGSTGSFSFTHYICESP